MSIAYLNGDYLPQDEARISPMDRGFLFGDGVYEVIPVYQGVPLRLEEHLQRLANSLAAIELDNPLSGDAWCELFERLIEKNGGGNLGIYLQVTRGTAPKRDHAFPSPAVPGTVFAFTSPVATPAADSPDTAEGAVAITLDDIRWSRCDIKSTALLANVMLKQQAIASGASEAILVRDGFATEGSASNFFIVEGGVVLTPPKSHLILPGVTRDLVVDLCHQHNVPIKETEVTEGQLKAAEEIWLSSSTRELVPVVTLNGHAVGDGHPGPPWKTMARHYVDFKRRLCGAS